MSPDIFVARQPIFDQRQNVFAYELLFRSSMENFFQGATPDEASSSVIERCLHDFGLSDLTGGRPAFINATKNVLVNDFLMLLPHEQTIVEILEDVEPDDEVMAACHRLKARAISSLSTISNTAPTSSP